MPIPTARLSPGIFTNEFDFTEYALNLGLTRPTFIGGASKGALSEPIEITSEADMVRKLGRPRLDDHGLQALVQYLKKGNNAIFLRIANTDNPTYGAIEADRPLPGLSGGTDPVAATGTVSFDSSLNPTDGELVSVNDGSGAVASEGDIVFSDNADDADYLTIDDGNGVAASATASFASTPTTNDTVTLNDAFDNEVIFEFTDGGGLTTGDIEVDKSATVDNGASEFQAAVNGSALNITAGAPTGAGPYDVLLTHDIVTNKGNSATIAVAGATPPTAPSTLSGADEHAVTFEFDNDSSTTPGSVAGGIGATIADTLFNLVQAINGVGLLQITASDDTANQGGTPTVKLVHDVEGADGDNANLSTIDADADLVLTQLTGGADGAGVTFEFDDDNAWVSGNVPVLIGPDAATTMANLIVAINQQTAVTAVDATVTVPAADLTAEDPGEQGNQDITTTGANITVTGLSGGAEGLPGVTASVVGITAISPGTWGNDLEVEVKQSTLLGSPAGSFDFVVRAPADQTGTLVTVERYRGLNLDPNSDRNIELVLEEGLGNEAVPSDYVRADVLEDNGSPSVGTYQLGVAPGTAGRDGLVDGSGNSIVTSADYIGSVTGQKATGLQALRNAELIETNVITIPGATHYQVINEMIDVAESRADALAVIDVPFGLSRDEVVDWHNGVSALPNSPVNAIDTSYAVIAWPWTQIQDDYNKRKVWTPPSGKLTALMAYTDAVAGPQFPIAGHARGVVEGLKLEYSPTLTDRDLLVGDTNRVNPFVQFPTGITFFGNRTALRRDSALNSLHIRRLLLHAEKLIATAVRFLVFEPNDPVTWNRFVQLVNPILATIQADRGLERFSVRCDETTNPPEVRRQKTMRGRIQLIPIEAAEIVEIDFAVFQSGAEFTEASV